MKTRQRVAFAILMSLSLFSGRSLLFRAFHHEPPRAAPHRSIDREALAPGVPHALASSLSQAAGSAPPDLVDELRDASWACGRLAEALEGGEPLEIRGARAVLARAHGGLGRAHLAWAETAYAAGNGQSAASELRAAVGELRQADANGDVPEAERPDPDAVLSVARRLEQGAPVSEQDFGGSVDVLSRALTRAAASA